MPRRAMSLPLGALLADAGGCAVPAAEGGRSQLALGQLAELVRHARGSARRREVSRPRPGRTARRTASTDVSTAHRAAPVTEPGRRGSSGRSGSSNCSPCWPHQVRQRDRQQADLDGPSRSRRSPARRARSAISVSVSVAAIGAGQRVRPGDRAHAREPHPDGDGPRRPDASPAAARRHGRRGGPAPRARAPAGRARIARAPTAPPPSRPGRSARSRRGSSLTASAPSLVPAASPSSDVPAPPTACAASSPIVRMPRSARRCRVTGPTPHIRPTGSGSRNARSRSGSTTTSPSGLATWDATLARCLVRAAPTEIGSPTSSRTRRADRSRDRGRRPEQVHRAGDVEERLVDGDALAPAASRRRASSITSSASRWYSQKCPRDERQIRAQLPRPPARPCRRARRTPSPRTTRRAPPPPPTAMGRPRSAGSSSCSTDA